MTVVYVASDEEGAGKTALCATLAHTVEQQGKSVSVLKPVPGAGLTPDSDPDADIYRKLLGKAGEGWPLRLTRRGITPTALEKIGAVVAQVSDGADLVMVEGSSGLSVEESERVAASLDARLLVVARYQHELRGAQLKQWQAVFGDRLLGFVINGLTRYMGTDARMDVLPSMEAEGLVCFGIIPEDRRLLGVTVGQLAEHLEGRFITCEEKADSLVEYFMVGGMGMDPGELYFRVRENKAVIVRGDRPDVQMSALATPTVCMVLTNGIEPVEYVKYEAEQEGVPLVVVPTDTLGTMDALATLMDRTRFDHPLKLTRFAELLEAHVDLPALLGQVAIEG